jgi:3-oxoisoapionate decarboxylase
MQIGISSWTYPWAIGVSGFSSPSQPMTLSGLLEQAAVLDVSVVQVADNLPLHKLDPIERRDAREQAEALGLAIEVGTRGVEPDHLLCYLDIAAEFDAVLVRTLTHNADSQPCLGQAETWIRQVLPRFEDAGVMLGLENYEKHSCRDLAELVRRIDSRNLGICLDTVNSLGSLETLKDVVEHLGRFTVNLHIKDFAIDRVPEMMGFIVSGSPAGAGRLEIPWLLKQIAPQGNTSAVLEQWPPLLETVEATIANERNWAEQGVNYLRSCGCI